MKVLTALVSLACLVSTAGQVAAAGRPCYIAPTGAYSKFDVDVIGELYPIEQQRFIIPLPESASLGRLQIDRDGVADAESVKFTLPKFKGVKGSLGTVEATGVLTGLTAGCQWPLFDSNTSVYFSLSYLQGSSNGKYTKHWSVPGYGTVAGYTLAADVDTSVAFSLGLAQTWKRWTVGAGLAAEAIHGELSASAFVLDYSYTESTSGWGVTPAIEAFVQYQALDWLSVGVKVRCSEYPDLTTDFVYGSLTAKSEHCIWGTSVLAQIWF